MMAEGRTEHPVLSHSGSTEFFDFYCELCHDEGSTVEADGYCVDCREYMCQICLNCHRRTRQTKNHRLLDKESMPKDTPLSDTRTSKFISTTCSLHPTEPVSFYCKTDSVLVCKACFIASHEACPQTVSIVDESEHVSDSSEFLDFAQLLKFLSEQSNGVMDKARRCLLQTQASVSSIKQSVRQQKEQFVAKLEKMEKDFLTEVDALLADEEKRMAAVMDVCDIVAGTVETKQLEISDLQSSRRNCQLYVLMKEQLSHFQSLQNKLCSSDEKVVFRKWSFESDDNFRKLVESSDALGIIKVWEPEGENSNCQSSEPLSATSTALLTSSGHEAGQFTRGTDKLPTLSARRGEERLDEPVDPCHDPISAHSSSDIDVEDGSVLPNSTHAHPSSKASFVGKINVQHRSDRYKGWILGSCVSGCAVMGDDRLVIADKNNNNVKLINTKTNELVCALSVPSNPWDVAYINRSLAALTSPWDQTLLLISVTADTLKILSEISATGACRGVAYTDAGLLVTYVDIPRLEVLNLEGEVVKTVKHDSAGDEMFKWPGYVCAGDGVDSIYVSDRDKHTVFRLNIDDGSIISSYSGSEIEYPTSISVDTHGHVYVCCKYGKTVHVLTPDLQSSQVILTPAEGVDSDVRSISHCTETNRLYVGLRRNNYVKVFQLI